jgi:hypothetical protein
MSGSGALDFGRQQRIDLRDRHMRDNVAVEAPGVNTEQGVETQA